MGGSLKFEIQSLVTMDGAQEESTHGGNSKYYGARTRDGQQAPDEVPDDSHCDGANSGLQPVKRLNWHHRKFLLQV
jgi:hypothetical protein